jgi:hypothetical protein
MAPAVFILIRSSWCECAPHYPLITRRNTHRGPVDLKHTFYSENEEQYSVGDGEMVRV